MDGVDAGVRERETSRRSPGVLAQLLGGVLPSGFLGRRQGRQGNVESTGRAMSAAREQETQAPGTEGTAAEAP